MTTTTFPIFRGLQRAVGGGAGGVGKHEPALTVTAKNICGKDEKIKEEEIEEKLRLPDGQRLDAEEESGILLDHPSTWPINSAKARQLRRDFVQEGFRRLYDAAAGQHPILGAIDAIGNNEHELDDGIHEGEGFAVQLRQTVFEAPHGTGEVDEWIRMAVKRTGCSTLSDIARMCLGADRNQAG